MSLPDTTAKLNECDDVTGAKVDVKVKVRVKEDDEESDKTGTLQGRCQPACSRDRPTVSTRRAPSQRR